MITVITDINSESVKNALRNNISLPSVIELNDKDLTQRIKSAIEQISMPIGEAVESIPEYELERLTFTIAITGTGEVSLLSLVKASSSVQSGIQVTIVPKK